MLVGLKLGAKPSTHFAPDFWLVQNDDGQRIGYVTPP
jgi:hypothetical protein